MTILPVVLKALSAGTEVAGIVKYLARTVRVGYREQFFFHHSRG